MKKTTSKKASNVKIRAKVRPVASKTTIKPVAKNTCSGSTSVSLYVFWCLIIFFIAATFYILGRAHNVQPTVSPVEITEEVLLQSADYYENGKTKLVAGQIDEAIADLTAAIDSGAASVDVFILRGEAHMQAGNYRDAMADFNAALSKDPANAVAYYDRCVLNTRLEDYSAALNDITNALAANSTNPTSVLQTRDLYAKRGQLNLWMKNWESAVADYTNALAHYEGVVNPTIYAERAEAFTAMGNYADAISDYTTAIRLISEQISTVPTIEEREALSSRAMNYFEKSAALNLKLGNVDASRSDLESAFTIAVALEDSETISRLKQLIDELLNNPQGVISGDVESADTPDSVDGEESISVQVSEPVPETNVVE